jgi:hypothetical protein
MQRNMKGWALREAVKSYPLSLLHSKELFFPAISSGFEPLVYRADTEQ